MEYTLKTPEFLGETIPLYCVAECMASRTAAAGRLGFQMPTFDGALPRYIDVLIDAVKSGHLQVCSQYGQSHTPDELVERARREGRVLKISETENTTMVKHVYVNLHQLNLWAQKQGDVFRINSEWVVWADNGGFQWKEQPQTSDQGGTQTNVVVPANAPNGLGQLLASKPKPRSNIDTEPAVGMTKAAMIEPVEYEWPRASDHQSAQAASSETVNSGSEAPPAPAVPVPAMSLSASSIDIPGLRTRDISQAFDGVNAWSSERWIKNLSANKWLSSARMARGEVGGASALWNPLEVAHLLYGRKKGEKEKLRLMTSLRARFKQMPMLHPWSAGLNDYCDTYLNAD